MGTKFNKQNNKAQKFIKHKSSKTMKIFKNQKSKENTDDSTMMRLYIHTGPWLGIEDGNEEIIKTFKHKVKLTTRHKRKLVK